jgi:hypothetical protein
MHFTYCISVCFEVCQLFFWLAVVLFSKIPFVEGKLTILWPPELAGFQCITAQFYYKGTFVKNLQQLNELYNAEISLHLSEPSLVI